jgi:BirA family biotin operon repressor/biotin-[acetyl-CoA-carboxylase] ligase
VSVREFHDRIPSTQDRAIELARGGGAPGTRVVAGEQTHGRGRSDHLWASPAGGLYLSLLVPDVPASPTLLPIAIGAGIADRLEDRFGVGSWIKWPNDLLVLVPGEPPRKLGGTLVDRVAVGPTEHRIIVGVGINVATCRDELPAELRSRTAFLGELAVRPPSLREVEEEVVEAVLDVVRDVGSEGGRARLHLAARRRFYGSGHRALVDGSPVGRIEGLADDGALRVVNDDAMTMIRAGDLTIVEEA